MSRPSDLEGVPGVADILTPQQCRQTAESIAAVQESSGEIPWSEIGHTDVWDHVECAMALTAAASSSRPGPPTNGAAASSVPTAPGPSSIGAA